MVACTNMLDWLAAQYASQALYLGICTGNPGSTATPANEASGGTPAYARISLSWSAGTTGVQGTTPVTTNLAAGTYNYATLCSGLSGANQKDNIAFSAIVLPYQGQIISQPSYTQT